MFNQETKKHQGLFHKGLKYLSYVIAALVLAALLVLIIQIFINGASALSWHFLFGQYDELGGRPSLLPSLVATGWLILISILIAVPLGVSCAVFLNEYTKADSKASGAIRMALDILAGIPSIVFGLFGMLFFSVLLGLGSSIVAGAFTMVIVILPPTVRSVDEALKAVPVTYREGSLALGAGKIRTVSRVVLPNAVAGIANAIILGTGRVIGESAVIILTLGGVFNVVPAGAFAPGSSLASTLYFFANTGLTAEAYATGIVLLILVFTLNFAAYLIQAKFAKRDA